MSKRFKDTNGAGASVVNKSDRMKLIGHLQDASARAAPDAAHVVHGHLLKAANVIGAIGSRSEDASSAPGNLTSPGTISNLSNRPGTATHVEGASITISYVWLGDGFIQSGTRIIRGSQKDDSRRSL